MCLIIDLLSQVDFLLRNFIFVGFIIPFHSEEPGEFSLSPLEKIYNQSLEINFCLAVCRIHMFVISHEMQSNKFRKSI